MKTAGYFTYFGPGRVGISRGNPRGLSGYRIYRALAPWRYMLDLSEAEYRDIYFDEILAHLDPAKVVADLEALAGDHEPVLLCFERPPFTPTNWCHRRMVAEWLTDNLGLDVPELERGGGAAPPTPRGETRR